jgi:acyl carrier protein
MDVKLDDLITSIKRTKLPVDVDTLDHKKTFQDQGIDSLDFSSILFNIEEDFNTEIPEGDVEKVKSISELFEYLNSK